MLSTGNGALPTRSNTGTAESPALWLCNRVIYLRLVAFSFAPLDYKSNAGAAFTLYGRFYFQTILDCPTSFLSHMLLPFRVLIHELSRIIRPSNSSLFNHRTVRCASSKTQSQRQLFLKRFIRPLIAFYSIYLVLDRTLAAVQGKGCCPTRTPAKGF